MKLHRYHLFLGTVSVVFMAGLLFFTGLFNLGGGRTPYPAIKAKPPDNDWYIDMQYGLTESHYHVLYRAIGPSIEHARQADVLILGDSHALLGFDWRQVAAFNKTSGVKLFNLAVDGATGWEFPLAVMKKQGLRPKAVLIATPELMTNPVFPAAREAMDGSSLTSFKYVLSGETMWRIKNVIGLCSPRLFDWIYPAKALYANYRSVTNGCWFRDDWIDDPHTPVTLAPEPCGQDVPLPKAFLDYLAAGGTKVLVGNIPTTGYCPAATWRLAQRLHAEGIVVSPEGLTTYDGSHLDKASSELFTKRFLDALSRTATFRALRAARTRHARSVRSRLLPPPGAVESGPCNAARPERSDGGSRRLPSGSF